MSTRLVCVLLFVGFVTGASPLSAVTVSSGTTLQLMDATGEVGSTVTIPVHLSATQPLAAQFQITVTHPGLWPIGVEAGAGLTAYMAAHGPTNTCDWYPGCIGTTYIYGFTVPYDPQLYGTELFRFVYSTDFAPVGTQTVWGYFYSTPPEPVTPQGTATITITGATTQFLPGDANGDGTRNIADPIALLGYLFNGEAPLACEDAADSDDDGNLQINDAIALLQGIFGTSTGTGTLTVGCQADTTTDMLLPCSANGCP